MEQNSNSDTSVTRRYLVFGKVQGVWFRGSTKEQAALCEVTGYAKNLHNGSVEVMLQGSADGVNAMFEWLHHGSRMAKVESVVEVDAGMSSVFKSFKVL